MKRAIPLLLLSACVGRCGTGGGIVQYSAQGTVIKHCESAATYVLDASLSDVQKARARHAFAYWQNVTGVHWTESPSVGARVHAVPKRVDGLCGWTSYKSKRTSGCIIATSIDIELSNACGDASSATLDTDMRHEIGHAMGFVHSEFREDLMFHASPAGLNKARDLSVEELMDVHAVYGGVQ